MVVACESGRCLFPGWLVGWQLAGWLGWCCDGGCRLLLRAHTRHDGTALLGGPSPRIWERRLEGLSDCQLMMAAIFAHLCPVEMSRYFVSTPWPRPGWWWGGAARRGGQAGGMQTLGSPVHHLGHRAGGREKRRPCTVDGHVACPSGFTILLLPGQSKVQ